MILKSNSNQILKKEAKEEIILNLSSQQACVSIVIAAKDEERSIVELISQINRVLNEVPYEIVVVDDGSKDNTGKSASDYATVVVTHEETLGKGAAMKSGVESSSGALFVFIDGDGAHKPQDILKLITPVLNGEADMVIGSRLMKESLVDSPPLNRRLSNQLASVIISIIISYVLPLCNSLKCPMKWHRITDCTSGLRAIKRENWQKLNLVSNGFQIETEMIFEAAKNSLRIIEVPISCVWDNQFSKLSILRDGFRTLKLLTRKLFWDINGR